MTWAVVTGGSSRGGAAICRALHAYGQRVVVHHSPASGDKANAFVDELCSIRPNSAKTWLADLSLPVVVPPWLADMTPSYCICNASVYKPSTVQDATRAAQDWAVHVAAHASLLGAIRPSLRSVTAVTDVHVDRPAPGYCWYTVSKAALQAMILTLSIEWAPDVRCNVVAPGSLPLPEDWGDDTRREAITRSIPLERFGGFDDLANAVRWLALEADYVTGQVLAVDGGRSRWLP